MSRIWTIALVLAMGLGHLAVTPVAAAQDETAAQRRERRREAQRERNNRKEPAADRRAKKPAEQRDSDTPADREAYERDLAAARAQRDADLTAAQSEKDPAQFEQKKQQVFAKYAALVAALRDKYNAANPPADQPEASRSAPPAPSSSSSPASAEDGAETLDALKQKLAVIEQKLAAEVARHEAKLRDLEQKQEQAADGGRQKQIDKAAKAVEKEKSIHAVKKADLESQRTSLQQQIEALSPTPN